VVLALPRGGVPVGFEIAKRLNAPLDVVVVRKIGAPGHPELALGAIATGGVMVLDRERAISMGYSEEQLNSVIEKETVELHRREQQFRGTAPALELEGKTVILVDDGLATGSTMRAAAEAMALLGPTRVVVAVPVAARETCEEFHALVDEVICLLTPEPFYAVGVWYKDFEQTSDDEVRELLAAARSMQRPSELLHAIG
jgi:predicted phosphoribosyltransferase